jgi:GDP-L-fucose synthase
MVRRLGSEGYSGIITEPHSALDLLNSKEVARFFNRVRPEYVVLAAGRVGGIAENQIQPADFMTQNIGIQLNVLGAAHETGVRKLVFFGSSCMYPRDCPQPMAEDVLLTARPEPTSLPYAISKLAGTYMCLAYCKQYGNKRFLPVIPNSIYGPNDNFDPKSAHVLSALIARFHDAKLRQLNSVTLWGSGTARREFIHADDIADACLHLLKRDLGEIEFPLNIGVGYDMSIKELAETIAEITGFDGRIDWDKTKPDGAPRKLLDSSNIRASGWRPKIDFREGLLNTYKWYLEFSASPAAGSPQ